MVVASRPVSGSRRVKVSSRAVQLGEGRLGEILGQVPVPAQQVRSGPQLLGTCPVVADEVIVDAQWALPSPYPAKGPRYRHGAPGAAGWVDPATDVASMERDGTPTRYEG